MQRTEGRKRSWIGVRGNSDERRGRTAGGLKHPPLLGSTWLGRLLLVGCAFLGLASLGRRRLVD